MIEKDGRRSLVDEVDERMEVVLRLFVLLWVRFAAEAIEWGVVCWRSWLVVGITICSEVAAMVRRIEGWKEGKVKVTEETKVNGGW